MASKEVLLKIARHPPAAVVDPSTQISDTLLKLKERGVRHALVGDGENRLVGIVSAKDIINYLGGGDKHRIVQERFRGDVGEALRAPVSLVMKPKPFSIRVSEGLADAINIMLSHDIGVLPILDEEGKIWGLVSERHIFKLLSNHQAFVKVSEIMTSPVISSTLDTKVVDAMKIFVKNDIRRLPLLDQGKLRSVCTIKDCVRFIAQNMGKLFDGRYEEVFSTPLSQCASSPVYTIDPHADVVEAARLMGKRNIGCLPVVDGDELVGMITERDFLIKLPKIKGVEYMVDTVRNAVIVGRVSF